MITNLNRNLSCTVMLVLAAAIPAHADSTANSALANPVSLAQANDRANGSAQATIDAEANKCDQPLATFMSSVTLQVAAPTSNIQQGRKALQAAPSPRYKQVIAATYSKALSMKERHRLVDVRLHDQVVGVLNNMVVSSQDVVNLYTDASKQLEVLSNTQVPECTFAIKYLATAYQGQLKMELETARFELKKLEMQRLFHQAKIAELRQLDATGSSVAVLN